MSYESTEMRADRPNRIETLTGRPLLSPRPQRKAGRSGLAGNKNKSLASGAGKYLEIYPRPNIIEAGSK